MPYYLGIDGGGSNLRMAVVDEHLVVQRELHDTKANPNTVGVDQATLHIQETIRETLADFPHKIRAVGIGISGAPREIASEWLTHTVQGVLPDTLVVPSSDQEIALVGAHSERLGILILSGTGSIAFGANEVGETLTIGGWGYVMGDIGSGFWLGLQAVHAYVRQWEGTQTRPSMLFDMVRHAYGFATGYDVIPWLYMPQPDSSKIAKLAPLVLDAYEHNDWLAQEIVATGVAELALLVNTLKRRLNMPHARVAFGGSLLTHPTPLAKGLIAALHLPEHPIADHSAVIGAALLAKLTVDSL